MQVLQALIAKVVGAFLLLALAFGSGYLYRDSAATKEALEDQLTAFQRTDQVRQGMQGEIYAIAQRYVAQQAESSATTASTIGALHDAGYRLRIELADAKVAAVTGDRGRELDGKAELSDRSSEFLIGQARKADEQVTALQDVIRVLQGDNTTDK